MPLAARDPLFIYWLHFVIRCSIGTSQYDHAIQHYQRLRARQLSQKHTKAFTVAMVDLIATQRLFRILRQTQAMSQELITPFPVSGHGDVQRAEADEARRMICVGGDFLQHETCRCKRRLFLQSQLRNRTCVWIRATMEIVG